MFVGVAKVRLHLPENQSLKGKRQVVKSLIARVQNHFTVAIAEVGEQDLWQVAELGVSCVSGDARHADEVLAKVVAFIVGSRVDADVADYDTEILNVL